ncbi:hypothetical protein QTN93_05465 [Sphingomonas aerolata]|uniref:hypothetical protein n=2 Tax=Sphingomonas aerolata TaxID=185951 RepID=UPI003362DBF2
MLANGISALHGAELVLPTTLHQALVRFRSPERNATEEHDDARIAAVIAAINAEGTAFFSGTVWRGRRAMRISVNNWRKTIGDVDTTIAAVARVLAEMDQHS